MAARLAADSAAVMRALAGIAASPVVLSVAATTLRVSFVVTIGCLLLGYPVAYFLTRIPSRIAYVLMLGVVFPIWVNIVVRTYTFMLLLGRRGLLNSTLVSIGVVDEPLRIIYTTNAVYLGMMQIMLPYMILILFAAIKSIDPSLLLAARSLGASGPRVFARILVPMSLPGIWGGCLLVFVQSLGFFVTPALLGSRHDAMIVQLIERNVRVYANFEQATILALLVLGVTTTLLALYNRFFGLDRLWGGLRG